MTDHSPAQPGETLLILGAGLVGSAAAVTFARRGFKVTLMDRDLPGSGASHGNAGGIVPSASPLAQPGLPFDIPKMLFDPLGPLSLKPVQAIKSFPWFLRFLKECSAARAEENSIALYALTRDAAPAWKELVRGTPAESLLRDVGWLKVYSSEDGFRNHAPERDFLTRRGAPLELLSQDELRRMEPNLAKFFVRAMWQPDGLFVRNPRRLCEIMAETARGLGAAVLQEQATDLAVQPDGRVVVTTDRAIHRPDRVMICAGAYSKRFAKQLGAAPMLVAERGYHAMFDVPEKGLERPVFWVENSMVLCPMEHGMRLTTQSEFTDIDAPPDFRRLERLVAEAGRMLPGLDTTIRDRWMGRRPSTPDSLPYLGPAPATPRAYFNFGHNHLGLTLSAVSARRAADAWMDAWTGRNDHSSHDLSKYRALR